MKKSIVLVALGLMLAGSIFAMNQSQSTSDCGNCEACTCSSCTCPACN